MNFNDYYWHDSILLGISIDRSNPGENDTVVMYIDWYDQPPSSMTFRDVYLLKATMNFGIIAKEMIDDAYVAPSNDEDLQKFYADWGGMYDSVELNCYIIKTSSTGSEIKIIAAGFDVG